MKAVLFDLEGTLIETVYERVGREVVDRERREVKKKIIGLGVPEEALGGLVRHTLLRNRAFDWVDANMSREASAKFHAELDGFMKAIEMWSARQAKLFPDALEALSKLAAKGVGMGLATNTSREAADYMLKTWGFERFFSVVVTRNDAPRLKPNPAMIREAVTRMEVPVGWLVGDTIYDAEAASSKGLMSIIVRRNGLRPSFSHDYFVNSLNDVASIVIRVEEPEERII